MRARKASATVRCMTTTCDHDMTNTQAELAELIEESAHIVPCGDTRCCAAGTLVARYYGGSICAFDLDGPRGLAELREEWQHASLNDDRIVDLWYVGVEGEPTRVTATASASPFDEDDYADARVAFALPDGRKVATIAYRIDGRS